MAELQSEPPQPIAEENAPLDTPSTENAHNGSLKREREDEEGEAGIKDETSKKPKVDEESADVKDAEMKEVEVAVEEEKEKVSAVKLGPMEFESGIEMFDYFFKLLHDWPTKVNVNKYEHLVLLDLLKKGHAEPNKKIGGGIEAFQVRFHPLFKSRCFFLVRVDGSSDDFSFRKCVHQILPLPENMQVRSSSEAKKLFGGNQKGGGGGRGGGRGGQGYGRRGGFRK